MDPVIHIFTYAVQRSLVEPFLPTQVVFTVSADLKENVRNAEYMDKGMANLAVRWRRAEYLKNYEPGFVGGEYCVTEWTNMCGLVLPLSAWLNRYSGMLRGDGGKPLLAEHHRIFATNLSPRAPSNFLPALEFPSSIMDRRIKDAEAEINYAVYMWTNNYWPVAIPPIAQTQLVWLKGLKAGRFSAQSEPEPSRRKVVAVAIVCVAVLPLVFLCSRRLLRKCKSDFRSDHTQARITPGCEDS